MIVFVVVAVVLAGYVAPRLVGVDGNRYLASGLALVPYVTVAGLVLGVLAFAIAPWWTGAVLCGLTAILACLVVPRWVPRRRAGAAGVRLTVLASNLLFGQADVKTVVELVRAHDVDVLTLLELTPECADELGRAGLFELLPHRVLRPADGGRGSGIASRHPLTELALAEGTTLAQPSARLDVDGTPVEVVAVHPLPPPRSVSVWRDELAALPTPDAIVRVLAGDFNASLDHAAFRRLLRAGYVDAARERGAALRPTWRLGRLPLVTLDHVVVDARVAVTAFRVLNVPGSDHKAVCAQLVLPAGQSR